MGADEHLVERLLHQVELFCGRFLHAFRDTVAMPDGKQATREYFRHPGAVMVIPFDVDAGGGMQLVLERQFRYPVGQVMLEWPAGKKEPGEDSWRCAQRELEEETGFRAQRWARLPPVHPAIAYSTESIDVWLATGLVAGRQRLDSGEFLDVLRMGPDAFFAACLQGAVTDAKTLAGAYWLREYLEHRLHPAWTDLPEHESL
ncbi:MAG: NUDIX domain-containing protein [Rhodoferax sp.]